MIQLVVGCASPSQKSSFDPKTCLENIPSRVNGLEIIDGPRTEQSLIRDMMPAICSGQALFRHMKAKGESINPGRVVFKVRVEWTGEVISVTAAESSIQSKKFLREVSDFIMDSDFVAWSRHDDDTIFLYPANFGF
jgi:hypothetical protein